MELVGSQWSRSFVSYLLLEASTYDCVAILVLGCTMYVITV